MCSLAIFERHISRSLELLNDLELVGPHLLSFVAPLSDRTVAAAVREYHKLVGGGFMVDELARIVCTRYPVTPELSGHSAALCVRRDVTLETVANPVVDALRILRQPRRRRVDFQLEGSVRNDVLGWLIKATAELVS